MPGDYVSENLNALGAWFFRHRRGFAILGVLVLVIAGLAGGTLYMAPRIIGWYAPKLDLSHDLYAINRPVAFDFLDAEGKLAGHRGATVGERLTINELPAYLPAAFIAMEDRRFYEHHGVDLKGLIRAAWINYRAGHVVQGGSTITQQLAKIIFLTPQRTYSRKYKEMLDAAAIENVLSKEQILELYLNRIYLGSGAYGVDGAARVYFGKSARDLSLSQAAMLATLTRAPSAFSPRRDLEAAQDRASLVLRAMVQTHAITTDQAEAARAHPAVIVDRTAQDARNYFLDTAADEARRDLSSGSDEPRGDLLVHTTLEPRLQEAARVALLKTLHAKGRKAHAHEGAVVVMKPDGAVSALLGGRDYDTSVFNRATQAKRQPGSAFKPFVYLAALVNGLSPWDTRGDGPVDIDGWKPTNFGGRVYGTVTLASALAHSINTVTAQLAQEIGIDNVIAAARACGITSPLADNASLALGTAEVTPLELTGAYATFANGGMKSTPYLVTEVDDKSGHAVFRRNPPASAPVIEHDHELDMVAMLYGVITEGTGRAAALPGREAAGKTGTTQDYHDAWFVGFTTDYVAGVWVGNDDSKPMNDVTGGSLPAAIWKDVMLAAEEGLPPKPLEKSPPEAPITDNPESAYASGDASPGYDTEDQGDNSDGDSAQAEHHESFFDWLFGRRGNTDDGDSSRDDEERRERRAERRDYNERMQNNGDGGTDRRARDGGGDSGSPSGNPSYDRRETPPPPPGNWRHYNPAPPPPPSYPNDDEGQ